MNGFKAVKTASAILALGALVGCGQEYTPNAEPHVASPFGGGNVLEGFGDQSNYRTVSYEVLRSTLADTMGVTEGPLDGNCASTAACPKSHPISFLDANKNSLGAPIYNQEDPNATQAPGTLTSGGFKVWILASTSACGRMMDVASGAALFPQGVGSYQHLYLTLIGRAPTADEIAELDTVAASFGDEKKKGAAVCSTVLGSLEFLTAN